MKILELIITDILYSLYQPFLFAILLSVCFMFVWKEHSDLKSAVIQWVKWFRNDVEFRKMFILVLYSVMILFRTLLIRSMWANPISDVIGVWGMFDAEGKLTTEVPENIALFIPFSFLLLWANYRSILGNEIKFWKVLYKATVIAFVCSFSIEMLQLFLRLGTWQLSDLFYNTLGGLLGGLIFYGYYKMRNRK